MSPQHQFNHSQKDEDPRMPPNTAGAHPRLAISMAISAVRRCSVSVVAMTSINNPTVKAIIMAC